MKIYKKIYLYSNERYQEFELFEHNFAEKNKYKYKIICKNKMNPLQSILKFIENSNEELKITIISRAIRPNILFMQIKNFQK